MDNDKPDKTPAVSNKDASAPHTPEAASMCSDSTVDQSALVQRHVVDEQQVVPLQQEIEYVNRLIRVVAPTCAGSLGAFLLQCLPFWALVMLALFCSSICALLFLVYRNISLQYTQMMQERGIGDYLPASIYQQLVEMSLHEWMMDDSFYMENRHLLIYFIPGLTEEQRMDYINRLPPRHRIPLDRPGLGQFFGNDFMRVIMGENRWNARLAQQQLPETQVLAVGTTSRQLFDENDDSSSLGLDVTERDFAGGLDDQQQAVTVTRHFGLSSTTSQPQQQEAPTDQAPASSQQVVPSAQELEEEQNLESDILTEATVSMITSYGSMATDVMTGYAVQAVEYISPVVIGLGASVTSGATGLGLFGMWLGVYHPTQLVPPSPRLPHARTLLSTAFMGGASAGMMLLIRTMVRRTFAKERLALSSTTESQEKDKKE